MLLRFLPPLTLLLLAFTLLATPPDRPAQSGDHPEIAKASDEAEKALPRFQMDKRLKATVWAAEPLLANPVSFTFDERGRCFVCETFRHFHGVTDNRNHLNWIDEDLASRSVADRVAMLKKDAKDKFAKDYETARERIQIVEDTTGAGKADKSTVFSDRFGRAEDGILAGVLVRKGNVYATCIPDLLKYKDTGSSGLAEAPQVLATGFGIHVALLGHDLHGLTMGPDGKLYFSLGDRGANVVNKEGKRLYYPDMGGVYRCDPDGSNMEMVHKGLRNPQELAFDDFGNLFTVDNNSDSGDKTRFTYIVEGGDSGWRTGYQYGSAMGNRGPFNAENIWHTREADQPTFIVPPIRTLGDGPAGFTHYPGIGLSDRYKDHFFLCDFRGNSGNSGIWSFAAKPKGASFEMVDDHHFVWSVLATDCDFGPDGAFYLSDWVEGWDIVGKGRIYKVTDAEAMKNPDVAKAKELIASDLTKMDVKQLIALLGFPQQRVRQEAQFSLVQMAKANKGLTKELVDVVRKDGSLIQRVHALWAVGMILRSEGASVPGAGVLTKETGERIYSNQGMVDVISLFKAADPEIRAQAAKVFGETGQGIADFLYPLLKDPEPRVRLFAALAVSKSTLDTAKVNADVKAFIESNGGKDAYLRHAGVMMLSKIDADRLVALKSDTDAEVRLSAVLALRKLVSPKVSEFFSDKEPLVATEAIRAAHDLELAATYPALAALLSSAEKNPWVNFRTLNANYRLGGAKNAEAVAAFAASKDVAEILRTTALQMLATWAKPPRRDYVTGLTQNLGERDGSVAVAAFRNHLAGLFAGSGKVAQEASKTASTLNIGEAGPLLAKLVVDNSQKAESRVAALSGLEAIKSKDLDASVMVALASKEPTLRNAARGVLAKKDSGEALKQIEAVLQGNNVIEQQGVFPILASMKGKAAEVPVAAWLEKLIAGKAPPAVQLDVLEAAAAFKTPEMAAKLKAFDAARPKKDDLAQYRESEYGGSAERGREIFLKSPNAQCQRCHKLDGIGGEVGPPLNGVGKQKREYILESIVLPSKQIAKGYDSVVILTSAGKSFTGVLRSDDANEVKLIDGDGKVTVIKKADIEERRPSKSAMPDDLPAKIGKRDLRDLVEFLTTLKEEHK